MEENERREEDERNDDRRDIRRALHLLWGGTHLELAPNAKLVIAGKLTTAARVLDRIRAFGGLYADLRKARAEAARAQAAYEAAIPGMAQLMHDYRAALVARFGKDSPRLWPFGIRPAWARDCEASIATLFARYGKASRAARGSGRSAQGHLVVVASNEPEPSK